LVAILTLSSWWCSFFLWPEKVHALLPHMHLYNAIIKVTISQICRSQRHATKVWYLVDHFS
jgi:hypothetical protein